MLRSVHRLLRLAPALLAACSATPDSDPKTASGSDGAGGGGGLGLGGSGGSGGLDIGSACKVAESTGDAVPVCKDVAPPDSFAPEIQWSWTAPDAAAPFKRIGSFVTPLVGNFTDDNGDGAVDLCDVPDIIEIETWFISDPDYFYKGRMYLLAGDTGQLEFEFAADVHQYATPAFGDIDGDGLPEVVTLDTEQRLIAFEHDGSVKWHGDVISATYAWAPSLALYDLDGDGHVEILGPFEVFDENGKRIWGDFGAGSYQNYLGATPTAADLDGDGQLEVLFGHVTFHADGSPYWMVPGVSPGHPHVANLDDDPEPEVLLTTAEGITIVEHDGTVVSGPVRPTEPNAAVQCWGKPAVVHDFDGDDAADYAAGTCSDYSVYRPSQTAPQWSKAIYDFSGLAAATAFDFLGDGIAEAIYADEEQIYAFDGATGTQKFTHARHSGTAVEYPVVADVDNDGAAEVAFVWSYPELTWGETDPNQTAGTSLTVLHDAMERWIPARRIWNQHAYHVTNVREDGTIPKVMKKSWQLLNTFRTNSQIGDGQDCDPVPK